MAKDLFLSLFSSVTEGKALSEESSTTRAIGLDEGVSSEFPELFNTSFLNPEIISVNPSVASSLTSSFEFGIETVFETSGPLGVEEVTTLLLLETIRYPDTPTMAVIAATPPQRAKPLNRRLRSRRLLICVNSEEL